MSQEPVKGMNVTKVQFGSSGTVTGIFQQVGDKRWNRLNLNLSIAASFTETGRDEWSVYLADSSGAGTAMLNLWLKQVSYSSGGTMTLLGDVIDATNLAVPAGDYDYLVGVGKGDVTYAGLGINMQGMSIKGQIVQNSDSDSHLYARAFIVQDPQSVKRVAIVVADIWSCTMAVKAAVLQSIASDPTLSPFYNDDNVLISGTHTHSGPGGYSDYLLYNYAVGGQAPETLRSIVRGIVVALNVAHMNLAPGRIYLNRGAVQNCGMNRSLPAYANNPEAERNTYNSLTDTEMLLLKFVHTDSSGHDQPIGALNWYAIHPTDLGQKNTHISGDNKGWAEQLFETNMATGMVGAFANSNCGDVSPNVEYGRIPDGVNDVEHMQHHGQQQFEVARTLFNTATERVQGKIDYRHAYIDMANISIEGSGQRTYPAAWGVSFLRGSPIDSITPAPEFIKPGMTTSTMSPSDYASLSGALMPLVGFFQTWVDLGFPVIIKGYNECDEAMKTGHKPKPIVLAPGLTSGQLPHILPIQLFQIGDLGVTGIPGELTTMAGRRLAKTVLDELAPIGVKYIALATYANGYSQYITTQEEYNMQYYEGASTLFGPYTLQAYQQEMRKLATALKNGTGVNSATPESITPNEWPHYTVRNLTGFPVTLKLYRSDDSVEWVTLTGYPDVNLDPGTEKIQDYPRNFVDGVALKIRVNGQDAVVGQNQLLKIGDGDGGGLVNVGPWTLPA